MGWDGWGLFAHAKFFFVCVGLYNRVFGFGSKQGQARPSMSQSEHDCDRDQATFFGVFGPEERSAAVGHHRLAHGDCRRPEHAGLSFFCAGSAHGMVWYAGMACKRSL